MINDIMLYDKPGVIITGSDVVKTTKVKKWVSKNKPINYEVRYLTVETSDFKEVEKQLQLLVDSVKGITHAVKEKEVFIPNLPTFEYRLNVNTVLKAYNEEQFALLKSWYGVYD